MATLTDRIRARLDHPYHVFSTQTSGSARQLNAAIRAVLDLTEAGDPRTHRYVEVIAEELGVIQDGTA